MLLSDRFLGFFMVPAQSSWNYNFMGTWLCGRQHERCEQGRGRLLGSACPGQAGEAGRPLLTSAVPSKVFAMTPT